jgi:hypothetical protein
LLVPLPNASGKGTDVETLTDAVNAIAESLGTVLAHTFSGDLSVGDLSPDFPLANLSLTQVDFELGTPPAGSAAVLDILVSDDGDTFVSATGGEGVSIPAGATSGGVNWRASGGVAVGSLVRLTVLSVGSETAGADLVATIAGSM